MFDNFPERDFERFELEEQLLKEAELSAVEPIFVILIIID